MGDLADIAREILSATRIVTDAANASPGKPVNVSVILGLSPQVPTNFNVNLPGTLPGTLGALTSVVSALVNSVKIKVKYTVTKGSAAAPSSEFKVTPPLDNPSDFSELNSLNVAFLLKPPIGDDTELVNPIDYKIVVDIFVDVEGSKVHTGPDLPPDVPQNPAAIGPLPSIEIPVAMPALGIPAILFLAANPNLAGGGNSDNKLLVMVRASSPIRDLGTLVATINQLMGTLNTLRDVLGWSIAFEPFTTGPSGGPPGALSLALNAINTIPVVFFSIGNANNLEDLGDFGELKGVGDFNEKASSSLLIAKTGTQVTLYNSTNFTGETLNDEHSVFTAVDIATGLIDPITNLPIPPTGVGVDQKLSFVNVNWDTDAGESMDDGVESVHFGGI